MPWRHWSWRSAAAFLSLFNFAPRHAPQQSTGNPGTGTGRSLLTLLPSETFRRTGRVLLGRSATKARAIVVRHFMVGEYRLLVRQTSQLGKLKVCTALHCTALLCSALLCTALHCTAPSAVLTSEGSSVQYRSTAQRKRVSHFERL